MLLFQGFGFSQRNSTPLKPLPGSLAERVRVSCVQADRPALPASQRLVVERWREAASTERPYASAQARFQRDPRVRPTSPLLDSILPDTVCRPGSHTCVPSPAQGGPQAGQQCTWGW